LSILGSGIEAGMSQVLLKEREPIARVIELYRMHSEGVSQPMWAHPMPLACLWINQVWQPSPFSTLPY
ncbi:unnamed protein product, partial [marine sediment metagenome]